MAFQRAYPKGGEDIAQASATFLAIQSYSSHHQLICLHVMHLFYYSNCNSPVFKLNQKHFTKLTSFKATGSSHYQDQPLFPNMKLQKLTEIGIYKQIKLYTISQI